MWLAEEFASPLTPGFSLVKKPLQLQCPHLVKTSVPHTIPVWALGWFMKDERVCMSLIIIGHKQGKSRGGSVILLFK